MTLYQDHWVNPINFDLFIVTVIWNYVNKLTGKAFQNDIKKQMKHYVQLLGTCVPNVTLIE